MPSPFPGMDPYLERPNLWHGVHNRLITAIADALSPLLRPRYFVAVEEHSRLDDDISVGFTAVPDVGVIGPYTREPLPAGPVALLDPPSVVEPQVIDLPMSEQVRVTYLSIQEVGENDLAAEFLEGEDGLKVVTILEILSPWNKAAQEGRRQYATKRRNIFNSSTNLVEIDLLRSGQRFVQTQSAREHYTILVSDAAIRPQAHFYPFTVQQPIPAFHLPLQADDEWPLLDLNRILHDLYDRAGYDLRINYQRDPVPAFEGDDVKWVDALLRKAELR
ncbi:MAG: DUF4058 family protein [Caldilineaceae bacterium]|nr:DUF4058 family protein [Caldilineaceae bacterium]